MDGFEVFRKLVVTVEKLMKISRSHLEKFGLSGAEYGVLRNLDEDGMLTLSELSGRLLRVNSNITALIDNMEKKTLVLRYRDEDDRRMIFVRLTPQGVALKRTVVPAHRQFIDKLLSVLDEEEKEMLYKLLDKLEELEVQVNDE
ncbi:MAG: MarR family transcriptional regulator [Clostridia bacterium]|nr:MarR family transcriptional regulator [Clostridia bacterium]